MLYSGSLSGSQSVSTLSSPRSSAGWTVLANDRSDPSMEEASDENCSICLQVYELSDQLRPLPCRHAFHVECIDTWLKSNAQCPICRQEVTATLVDTML
ncbi:hypothetical protein BC939DRAFT_464016 [Gamsiella multidivaricata]|uniref:uncharacterized protein n=1 Tax=Gamsiella multidivaricata TaxID=101098 RepID=UPI00221E7DF5|nr:uncharacterized protein BC939DRAFT_464016 [Gamsiella multidivaricata]KAI7818107.1 hypothetical protein BC939DRAFT_464016 [Gamsiella multidivaricata]